MFMRSLLYAASSAWMFLPFPVMAGSACNPELLYQSIQPKTDHLERELQSTLGSRSGMTIVNVLWIGQGRFSLICDGQYPEVLPFARSHGPSVDRSTIVGWSRGQGSAGEPGRYVFQTSEQSVAIPVLPMNSDRLQEYGASIAKSGDILNTPEDSVLATYIYEPNYLDDFVLPKNGPRLERHPNDHMLTLLSGINEKESYFVVGKIRSGNLRLAAIRLEPGVTLHVRGNTVHTNDYVMGTVQEIYPEKWGIDEVRLVNDVGDPVVLHPSSQSSTYR